MAGGAAHTAVESAQGLEADADRMRANVALTQGAIVVFGAGGEGS
jgi:hypothetical protein